ncbi:DUF4383 domain-containing protein [Nocardioides sp. 1609]|uniref:DUF4383 domain-containing protein n=1 Tax=Nocardioides sp. 1609 TaxID=2508327 RepID=UPI001FD6DB4E|nr:DUF4383 domain-containing protein [Nocardioides sp. 1609]
MTLLGHTTDDPYDGRDRVVRWIATAVGVVFLVVGVLGFVPGVTTDQDTLAFAGHHSEAELLGIFQVSGLHNLLHIAFGLAGVVLGRRAGSAVAYLLAGGAAYLGLWVYGLVVDHDSAANVVPVNSADNYLHLALGLGMIALGLLGQRIWRGTVANRTAQ